MDDPGRRRPWVPYRQWIRQQEDRQRRVPGYDRNRRARHQLEIREGVRMPGYDRVVAPFMRDRDQREVYNRMAVNTVRARRRGYADEPIPAEWLPEAVQRRRRADHGRHQTAWEAVEYMREHPEDLDFDPEDVFDEREDTHAGRYEEYALPFGLRQVTVEDLPVIEPGGGETKRKKVKFEEE